MMTGKMEYIGLKRGLVQLVPHRREWSDLYEAEAQVIWDWTGDLILDVQHVGSTSVPGLEAKPILDIVIAVGMKEAIAGVVERLTQAGYNDYGDQGKDGGYLLGRETAGDICVAHLHIVETADPQWRNYIAFRDILRHDRSIRRAYADLKKRLSAQFPDDRVSYTAGKDEFIQDVLRKHGETLLQDENPPSASGAVM
jgi:GrpB-like predicted nucleotidyltransferase (UPF0157 family)